MSKNFKTQDYHRYKKLGMRWRRPKGRQSKLRKRKAGSGIVAGIGYRTKKSERDKMRGIGYTIARSISDIEKAKDAVIISSSVGARKAIVIAEAALQHGLKVLNAKKIKRAKRIAKELDVKRKMKELEKKEKVKEKEEGKKEKTKEEKKEESKVEKSKEKSKEEKQENKGEKQSERSIK